MMARLMHATQTGTVKARNVHQCKRSQRIPPTIPLAVLDRSTKKSTSTNFMAAARKASRTLQPQLLPSTSLRQIVAVYTNLTLAPARRREEVGRGYGQESTEHQALIRLHVLTRSMEKRVWVLAPAPFSRAHRRLAQRSNVANLKTSRPR